MEWIVRLVAPRNTWDVVLKTFLFLLPIGGLNYLRDTLEHGPEASPFYVNLYEATFVGLPFCVFALVLVGHLHRLQLRLIHLASTDLLTQLPNRRAFMAALEARQAKSAGTLLMVDIDHFKRVNDTYGHAVGDACLHAMAQQLRHIVNEDDFVARLGGEEFGVLLQQDAEDVVAHCGAQVAQGVRFALHDRTQVLHVTTSVGATAISDQIDVNALLRQADHALYQAKAAGRAQLRCFNSFGDAEAAEAAPMKSVG